MYCYFSLKFKLCIINIIENTIKSINPIKDKTLAINTYNSPTVPPYPPGNIPSLAELSKGLFNNASKKLPNIQ